MVFAYCIDNSNGLEQFNISESNMYIEKNKETIVIKQLIGVLEPGDTVVCRTIRDLGLSINQIIGALFYFVKKEVKIVCLQEKDINIEDIRSLIEALYQYGIELRNVAQKAGYEKALQEGRVGRPRSTGLEEALRLYDSRRLTASEICKITEISQSTLYRAVRDRREKVKKDSST